MITMFALGLIELIILAIVIAAIAIALKRPKVAAAIGLLLLVVLGLGAALFIPWLTFQRQGNTATVHVQDSSVLNGEVYVEQQFVPRPISMRPMWFGMLIIALPIALLVALASWLTSRKSAGDGGGGFRWWPVLLFVPLIALFVLGAVRVRSVRHDFGGTPQIVHMQQDIGRQQAEISRRSAEINAQVQRQFGEVFHEQMDRFDAPRIRLVPAPPVPSNLWHARPAAVKDVVVDESKSPKQSNGEAAESASNDNEADPKAEADVAASVDVVAANAGESTSDAESETAAYEPSAEEPAAEPTTELAQSTDKRVAPRPAWVDEKPKRIGDTWRDVIVTDEYATVEECYNATDIFLLYKINGRIEQLGGADWHFGSTPGTSTSMITEHPTPFPVDAEGQVRFLLLHRMGITIDYIRREIAKDEYVETVGRSFGTMKKMYTLIEFSPSVDRDLKQRLAAFQRQKRFAMVGVSASTILCLLGIVFGLLKFDTWTKGYYTKALFLGVPGAIIGALLFLVLILGRI